MRQSKLFPKTLRETPKDADNVSTALLTRGGFVTKLMAGSYTYEPLGWRVLKKIEQIIRDEIDAVGGQELFMPALTAKELWDRSGRWRKLNGDMYQFKDPSEREVGLAMTHEEVIVDLLSQQPLSYQDLPIALYQFQTKFRYEPRAKSGVLRTREFIMKDLYSVHESETDLLMYYDKVKEAYGKIFNRVGVRAVPTLASGGIFTDGFSHEFQSVCEIGEDTILACPELDYAVNKEVQDRVEPTCPNHQKKLIAERAVEVGNIFNLGTTFSERMNVLLTDQEGNKKPFWFASYGIGLGRLMGVIVEHHNDERGIVWPESVAPYQVHLLDLTKTPDEKAKADKVYEQLLDHNIEVLFDDRPVAPGVKFADADLLGIPNRLVVSSKTLVTDSLELKKRAGRELELIPIAKIDTILS